jgi:hypothetical protein
MLMLVSVACTSIDAINRERERGKIEGEKRKLDAQRDGRTDEWMDGWIDSMSEW